MLEIYTDGSSRGNPGPGGYGGIIIGQNNVIEFGGKEDMTTNNRMEMMAVIEGLKMARAVGTRQATIYSDSQYVIKGITEWIHGWRKNNWKNSQKKDVINKDLWEKMFLETKDLKLTWKHIKGHAGHSLNERADKIATTFADKEEILLYNGPKNRYTNL